MELILEIGSDEQKELIRQEIAPLLDGVGKLNPPLNLRQVVFAVDFDGKVNELQGTTDYRSIRGVTAIAKIVELDLEDGISIAIVLSPLLFTDEQDTQTRYFIYMHEITHVLNKRKFRKETNESYFVQTYLGNMISYYDEYVADRAAYDFIGQVFKEKTPRAKAMIDNTLKGLADIVFDPKYYEIISREVMRFRLYRTDVSGFLEAVKRSFDEVSLCTVHLYALLDTYPDLATQVDLSRSKFINEKAVKLMRFLKAKYEQHDHDLRDGIGLVVTYMENFGMRFEDRSEGLYCHVVDI